jgi:hypothetical protein
MLRHAGFWNLEPRGWDEAFSWADGHVCLRLFGLSTLAVCLAVAATGILLSASTAAADPTPFAVIDGSGSIFRTDGPVLTSAHPLTIYRMTSDNGDPLQASEGGNALERIGGTDTVWAGGDSYAAGDTPWVGVYGNGVAGEGVTFDLYGEPTAPISFSGQRSTASSGSDLFFNVPDDAPYTAAVAVAGGAVEVNYTTVDSSQTLSLGNVEAGNDRVQVFPVSGPPATWTVTVAPQPIVASAVKFSRKDHARVNRRSRLFGGRTDDGSDHRDQRSWPADPDAGHRLLGRRRRAPGRLGWARQLRAARPRWDLHGDADLHRPVRQLEHRQYDDHRATLPLLRLPRNDGLGFLALGRDRA